MFVFSSYADKTSLKCVCVSSRV